MKITTTAGTLKAGDRIGRRGTKVRYVTLSDSGAAYLVFVEGCETPWRYGRNETITVEVE